ncbi:MAG: hypothetical protein ABUT39_02745 [Acidobacteriota bacterium]
MSIRIRRTLAILVLAAASSIVTPAGLHAGPRERPRPSDSSERRVLRESHPIWRFLMSLWEENGLRIDDNG